MRRIIFLIVVLAAIGGGIGYWYWNANTHKPLNYRLAQVTRGKLIATIGATGTIEPEEVIDVGAQVAGRVERFGDDPAKTMGWGTVVDKGTVLAQLDASLYSAQVDAEKANVAKAQADKLQKVAVLEQAKRDFDRAENLHKTKSIAPADYDLAKTAFDSAKASLALSEAQILQATAALSVATTNLEYTTIKSPVKGTIIDRRVNIGQTVVASLQAPSLFLIAKDLSRVEIWASVNEADVGNIHVGQTVRFTVDMAPGQQFEGTVLKQGDYAARLNASMTQNVVTYTVVVGTKNPEVTLPTGKKQLLFLPYLTANLKFVIAEKTDALLVPNAALRYRPRADQIAPEYRAKAGGKRKPSEAPAPDKSGSEKGGSDKTGKSPAESAAHEFGTVWVKDGDYVKPVRVRIGYTDGIDTEILGGDLNETMEVIIGEGRTAPQAPTDANPFGPPAFFKGKKKE